MLLFYFRQIYIQIIRGQNSIFKCNNQRDLLYRTIDYLTNKLVADEKTKVFFRLLYVFSFLPTKKKEIRENDVRFVKAIISFSSLV
jgi:hypothetical protein